MTRYRCKHAVEAIRWDGESREALMTWHAQKAGSTPRLFDTAGSGGVSVGDDYGSYSVMPGEWLVWSDGEFLVMDDERFHDTYEASR